MAIMSPSTSVTWVSPGNSERNMVKISIVVGKASNRSYADLSGLLVTLLLVGSEPKYCGRCELVLVNIPSCGAGGRTIGSDGV